MNFFQIFVLAIVLIGVGVWSIRGEDPIGDGTSQEGLRQFGGVCCIVFGLCILADHLFLS